jgi:8-oxo-dGTP pyrophosphatase MutT (NUDIX family)
MIYPQPPEHFVPKFEVVSCFFERDGKFLLLLRQDAKPQGNTWGVPAGKVEKGETPDAAMIRELEEETGYRAKKNIPKLVRTVYVRYPEYDFTYHIYHLSLDENHSVKIDSVAHKEFSWVVPKEAMKMHLVPDLDTCIRLFYDV